MIPYRLYDKPYLFNEWSMCAGCGMFSERY